MRLFVDGVEIAGFNFDTVPEWPGKIIPQWWRVTELRSFLTKSHRKIRLVDVHAEALRRFGNCVPSQSAIHRYWQRLDALREAAGTPMQPTPQVTK